MCFGASNMTNRKESALCSMGTISWTRVYGLLNLLSVRGVYLGYICQIH